MMGTILDHDGGFGAKPEEIPELASTFNKTPNFGKMNTENIC